MSWTPSSPAGYFGTWMFLFFLGIIARALTAAKAVLERYWTHKFSSMSVVVNKNDTMEVVSGVQLSSVWRASVDFPRAFLQLVIQGVYYLLYSHLSD
jgi:Ctr copper transporter family